MCGRTATAATRRSSANRCASTARPATVIGVMPDGMRFPDRSDIWVPLVPTARRARGRTRRGSRSSAGCAMMPARPSAQAEFDGIARSQKAADPERLQGHRRRARRDDSGSGHRRHRPAVVPDHHGRGDVRAADCRRERRQSAAAAIGGARTGDGAAHRHGRHALAPGAAVAAREPRAVARRRGAGYGPCAGRGAGIRRGDAERRAAVLGGVLDRLRRARVCRRDRHRDGDRVWPGAGAARLEGQQQRRDQGWRPRQRRRPARAPVRRRDGGAGIVGGHRAARRRRPAGAQLRHALCDRSRREHRAAGHDARGLAGVEVSDRRRSARVCRGARAASGGDSRRAGGHHHDRRSLARRRRALPRGRGDAERRATRHGLHRHHHAVVLRHDRRAHAARPRVRGRRWRAGLRNRDRQRAARRAVFPGTGSDRPASALHARGNRRRATHRTSGEPSSASRRMSVTDRRRTATSTPSSICRTAKRRRRRRRCWCEAACRPPRS